MQRGEPCKPTSVRFWRLPVLTWIKPLALATKQLTFLSVNEKVQNIDNIVIKNVLVFHAFAKSMIRSIAGHKCPGNQVHGCQGDNLVI